MRWEKSIELESFNLTNRQVSAIDDYSSRPPGEPAAGVADIYLHPMEERSFRVSVRLRF
jgi:hypothetical protein